MNTVYYTFTTWNEREQAAGFGSGPEGTRQTSLVREQPHKARPQVGDNVIDLAAWRADNLELAEQSGEERVWARGECQEPEEELPPAAPIRRRGKSRRALLIAELVSTLSVVAVSAAIIIRVLTF